MRARGDLREPRGLAEERAVGFGVEPGARRRPAHARQAALSDDGAAMNIYCQEKALQEAEQNLQKKAGSSEDASNACDSKIFVVRNFSFLTNIFQWFSLRTSPSSRWSM